MLNEIAEGLIVYNFTITLHKAGNQEQSTDDSMKDTTSLCKTNAKASTSKNWS